MATATEREIEKLIAQASAELYGSVDEPPPPRGRSSSAVWEPDLNATQLKIWNDPSDYILCYGEKGSGKTIIVGYRGVRHCYENENALWLIITPSMRAGNEGIWFDLDNLILPAWKDGIGLEYTDSKLDPNTKDRHRWIRNRFGGWSKVLLMSVPYASQIEARIKGPAPSMVTVDELTNCDGVEYFRFPAAQLGRRRGIHGPQQFIAACNPAGPSHWVYKTFFIDCVDKAGVRDPKFAVYHVPIRENIHRLPPGYIEKLETIFRSDPVETRRLITGEWVDRPTGDGLFKEYFNEPTHIRGSLVKGLGLKPVVGFPIVVGYDLGQVFSSITFMQVIPTKENKNVWLVFDEIDHLGEKILYKNLAREVMSRMEHWRKLMDYEFQFMHVTDESAINQWRPGGDGSYDAWEFEKEFNRESGGRRVKMLGCPKGAGSVAARIRLLQSKLYQDEIFVSALCKNTREMLMSLESEKDDPEKPRRSKFIHKFDSLTYPIFRAEIGGIRKILPTARVAPTLIRCGSNF